MKYLSIFLAGLFFQIQLAAQDDYDVLPISGRNELFHTFLMERGAEIWDARRDSVDASLASLAALMERQAQLREDYRTLLGDMPEKTPLNAEVVGTIDGDGYTIEKVHFQSRPNHHVTANFYLPEGAGPIPAVLIMCGHYPVAKSIGLYQELSALFAQNGIAALIVDPFSQGERYQIRNPTTGNLAFAGQSGTGAHTRLDVGAMLAGTSVVAHAVWDNHRALDYLYERTDVVDTARVGATGSSGGGSQGMYLAAFDERIKVAAINSLIMNEETLFSTIGPQTGSQNLSYEGAHSIEHPDYVTMFAPKPYMILAATDDFFDINATHETRDEAMEVYDVLGVPDNFRFFEEIDADHGYLQPRREEGVRWFKKWFFDDDSPVSEADIDILQTTDLEVTATGEVTDEFADEKSVTDLNVEMADGYADDRAAFWTNNTTEEALDSIREIIRFENYDAVDVEETGTITREGYTITKMKINSGDHVPVTGLMFVPDGAADAPVVVYVDGRGKKEDADEGGVLEQIFVDSGAIAFSIDVRGFGETADNPTKNESKHGNKEHRNAVIGGYIGKTFIGQRVEDIMKALDVVLARTDVNPDDVTLVGIDRAGSAVLHAAALDARVTKTIIRQSFESWLPMVGNPTELHNLTHVVPFALKYYDLPDLVNAMPENSVLYFDEPYSVVSSTDDFFVENENGILGQNFPNPVSAETVIPYELKKSGDVMLKIYDQQGRVHLSIDQGFQNVGEHQFLIGIKDFSNGQYFYQLWVNDLVVGSKKMLVAN